MRILVSARLYAIAAPEAPAPMISTSTGSFIAVSFLLGCQRLPRRVPGARVSPYNRREHPNGGHHARYRVPRRRP